MSEKNKEKKDKERIIIKRETSGVERRIERDLEQSGVERRSTGKKKEKEK